MTHEVCQKGSQRVKGVAKKQADLIKMKIGTTLSRETTTKGETMTRYTGVRGDICLIFNKKKSRNGDTLGPVELFV